MTGRRRPSLTLICSTKDEAASVALMLISQQQTFTVEPNPAGHPWYIGVMPEGAELIRRHFQVQETDRVLGDEPGMKEAP